MLYRGMGLFVMVTTVLTAALLLMPREAGAQDAYCPAVGIVPGSVSVISTNNGAGQVSAHVVRFQICGGFGEWTITDIDGNVIGPPDKIGLLWRGFSLDEAGARELR